MDYEEARKRNALPVPDTQYGGGPTYNYWDEFPLNPPQGAHSATIDLLYQPTSWEYIQFLHLANEGFYMSVRHRPRPRPCSRQRPGMPR